MSDTDTTSTTEAATVPTEIAKVFVGQFQPSYPFTLEDLVGILSMFGVLNTGVFTGQDQQGNLINAQGGVVVPAAVVRHFRPVEVQATNA